MTDMYEGIPDAIAEAEKANSGDAPITEQDIQDFINTTPQEESKQNVHTFLHNVSTADDTTKIGNLSPEEVGLPKLPQRTYLDLALFCDSVANMDYFSNYLREKAEIISSTSLSKDAKLINLAVMQVKHFASADKTRKPNKSWFSKKETTKEEV